MAAASTDRRDVWKQEPFPARVPNAGKTSRQGNGSENRKAADLSHATCLTLTEQHGEQDDDGNGNAQKEKKNTAAHRTLLSVQVTIS